jgi:hypothetical protein
MRLLKGDLPIREQRALALRLVDVAEQLMTHADRRDSTAQPTATVIDHQPTPTEALVR